MSYIIRHKKNMSLRSYILQIMLYGTNHLKTYIIEYY